MNEYPCLKKKCFVLGLVKRTCSLRDKLILLLYYERWTDKHKYFYLQIFVFLSDQQISKFVTSSWALLHNRSYTFAYFFQIQSTINMKFGQLLLYCMANISNMFWINFGDWKLVPVPFMILLKCQCSEIWQFLIVDIYYF